MVTLLSWLGRTDLDQMKQDSAASIATIALKGKTPNIKRLDDKTANGRVTE